MTTVLYPSLDGPVWTYPNIIGPYVGAVMFETFLYGVYLIIFMHCMIILSRKDHIPRIAMLTLSILFAIASVDMAYTIDVLFRRVLRAGITYEDLRPMYIMYIISSTVADTLLVYRCYVIWDNNIRVVIGPALVLVIASGCGFAFEGTTLALAHYSWINLSLSAALNVIITTMIAGRLWYLSRSAQPILDNGLSHRYQTVVYVIIQSSLIYTLYVLLDLTFWGNATANSILDSGLTQIVGIVPTMIVVQLSLQQAGPGRHPMVLTMSRPPTASFTQLRKNSARSSNSMMASDNTVLLSMKPITHPAPSLQSSMV